MAEKKLALRLLYSELGETFKWGIGLKNKLLVTTLAYTSILALLVFSFQNCAPSSARFSEKAMNEQSSESIDSVGNKEPEQNIDLSSAKLTLKGVVRSGWRVYEAIGSAPIAGVTIHVKIGARADSATKNKPDFRTFTTDASGAFEFKDLPNNTYTLYWDVPANYYHENDYAAEFKVTQLNEEKIISDLIWVHQKGIVIRCSYRDGLPMKNLTAKLYESIQPRSKIKANSTVHRTETNSADGSFYMNTSNLPDGSGGGIVELSDSNGNVVGNYGLEKLNHIALSGGGYCE